MTGRWRFGFGSTLQVMRRRVDALDCRQWKLVLTGHSLGAGAASLVALYAHNFFPKCAQASHLTMLANMPFTLGPSSRNEFLCMD